MEFVQRNPAITKLCLTNCFNITSKLPLQVLRGCPMLTSLTLENIDTHRDVMYDLLISLVKQLYPALKHVQFCMDR